MCKIFREKSIKSDMEILLIKKIIKCHRKYKSISGGPAITLKNQQGLLVLCN